MTSSRLLAHRQRLYHAVRRYTAPVERKPRALSLTHHASGDVPRVAIIGAGPAGLYATDAMVTTLGAGVSIDVFEYWPVPFGLLRFGVAPDSTSIKRTTQWFDRILGHQSVRYRGNVRVGTDVGVDELLGHYHQVLLTTGARHGRRLDVPGETPEYCVDALDVVGWYNSRPDDAALAVDWRRVERLVVVGMGNTALDLARVLLSPPGQLMRTDIAPGALGAIRRGRLRRVDILARKGPAEVACGYRELERLAALPGVSLEVKAPELSRVTPANAEARKTLELLAQVAARPAADSSRTVCLRFQVAPMALARVGEGLGLELEHRVVSNGSGWQTNGIRERLSADLLVRATGFRGEPLPGVPFDSELGLVFNRDGRVGHRLYVAGWAKRGAKGLLGSTKADARETVDQMLAELLGDARAELHPRSEVDRLLSTRGVREIGLAEWRQLDQLEIRRGKAFGRPREKFGSVREMLDALELGQPAQAFPAP
jgi:ferredoxin--NADP+ reductase